MGKKMAKDEFDGMGATSKRDTWRPPKHLKKHKCEDKVGLPFITNCLPPMSPKMSKKKSWAVQFKEFRVFAECVLDYLRSQVFAVDLDNLCNMCFSGDERPLCAEDCHR